MPTYDTPGLTYDSGVFFDDFSTPQPTKHKMAKIKLNLSKLSVEDKLTLGNNIKSNMTTNVAVFVTPNPTLTAYGTVITNLTSKNATVASLKTQFAAAVDDRDATEKAFDASTTQLASYVDNIANGDPVIIGKAGMGVRAATTPAGVPGQVGNLALTAGDSDGELDAQWDPLPGAKSYEVQTSPDPITATSWVNKSPVTKSKTVLPGLPSGTRVSVRVRAVGTGGIGAWSDPAIKTVP
jgi:hypothetical protein